MPTAYQNGHTKSGHDLTRMGCHSRFVDTTGLLHSPVGDPGNDVALEEHIHQ